MLEIRELYKTFNIGTINEKHALNGVSLKLNPGDFVTVIGGNGAGKSTMLNAVAGVWPADSGMILIDGEDISGKSEYQRAKFLGRVFQDPMIGTAADMSILENLALAARRGQRRGLRMGVTRAEISKYKEALYSLGLGLEERLTTKVGLLSGGQRQALTLLMATIQRPKLLLLDEHTAALDPKTAAKVLSLTRQLVNENKLTALMVTHNMKDALQYGNRTVMMSDGRIIVDIDRENKMRLKVDDLLRLFETHSGSALVNDRMLLG
ncbi:MAG: ATP-binding cassette domain-containing protein [Clostridia bacterium]|nr:ATP-binding cassette domain-containing protein [Clostridia bacterium]MBR6028422.1 ATP-binding cassette domain-containing protein [Clostridia bacterium]